MERVEEESGESGGRERRVEEEWRKWRERVEDKC